ncbi:1-propanol dehydrogenase PduQ [Caniella muris]|uniref:1-propanol dehydrogenase PduQ n=1 Tax=Caniella muris TaxID=2941502 RepID=UPI0020426427|nr:1-propanol dehydrogenase PduQ [Caniella muris]
MSRFAIKTELHFGPRAVDSLQGLPFRRVLVVTDGFLADSGAVSQLTCHLPSQATCEVYSDVRPDPTQELVEAGVGVLERVRPDLVIAFGGGSSIDATKAMLYFARERAMDRPCFLAVPTTAGTGSEVTNFAIVTRGEDKVALIDDFLAPDGALLNARFTRTVPPRVTADTGLDVLTHALEAFVARGAGSFTDALCVKAVSTVFAELPRVFKDGGAMKGREAMLEASCAAGIAFTNAGLGINHSIAHALGGRFHVAHGRLNAVLLPYVLAFHEQDGAVRTRFDGLARQVGLVDCDGLVGRVKGLLDELGVERRLGELEGIEETPFMEALDGIVDAARNDRCTPMDPCVLSRQDFVNLCRDAFWGTGR